MFEAGREQCYDGIRKCDEFLKNYKAWDEAQKAYLTYSSIPPEQALMCFFQNKENKTVLFHLQKKMNFIKKLAAMQEVENAIEERELFMSIQKEA